eukprot:SAG31_NODE_1524_length_8006_cov_11.768812_6_plen_700_part_00
MLSRLSTTVVTAVGWTAVIAAVGLGLGIGGRFASMLYTACLLLLLLLEKTRYNNHYYFELLLATFFALTDAHSCPVFSIPGSRMRHVPANEVEDETAVAPINTASLPAWQLWVFRIQVILCYFYGGVAKINRDWLLRGEPMASWMVSKPWTPWRSLCRGLLALAQTNVHSVETDEHMQQMNPNRESEMNCYGSFFSWGGMVFDILVGFALLACCEDVANGIVHRLAGCSANTCSSTCVNSKVQYSVSRRIAIGLTMPTMLAFHLTNAVTFNIGAFPWMMLAANALFMLPTSVQVTKCSQSSQSKVRQKSGWQKARWRPRAAAILTLITMLVPLRGYLCQRWTLANESGMKHTDSVVFGGGGAAWTGIGYHFSWRMMLHDERVLLRILAPIDGGDYDTQMTAAAAATSAGLPIVAPLYRLRLTTRQVSRGLIDPDCVRQLAHYILQRLGGSHNPTGGTPQDSSVRVEGWRAVNFRPYQRWTDSQMILTSEDLAKPVIPSMRSASFTLSFALLPLEWLEQQLWPAPPPRWLVPAPFAIPSVAMARVNAARHLQHSSVMFFADQAGCFGSVGWLNNCLIFGLPANVQCTDAVQLSGVYLDSAAVLTVISAPLFRTKNQSHTMVETIREGQIIALTVDQYYIVVVNDRRLHDETIKANNVIGGSSETLEKPIAVWAISWGGGCSEGEFHRAIDFFSADGRAAE